MKGRGTEREKRGRNEEKGKEGKLEQGRRLAKAGPDPKISISEKHEIGSSTRRFNVMASSTTGPSTLKFVTVILQ